MFHKSPFSLTLGAVIAVLLSFAAPARADCYDQAADYHHVNHLVLRAIAWTESHNQPAARHRNDNGSVDYGLMQINSVHLDRLKGYGVDEATLMQACPNVYVAAWHLRKMMDKYGNTWAAVGAYHSETPRYRDQYLAKIRATLARWGYLPAESAASSEKPLPATAH